MSHPKFKLYRQKITPEDRERYRWIAEHQTHLITIDVLINGNKYTHDVVAITPKQLKPVTDAMFKEVIKVFHEKEAMISEAELKALGFKEVQPRCIEEDYYFDWMNLSKNNSDLSITTEYETNGKFITQYADFNGETLKGKKLELEDLKTLIKLM